MPENRGAFKDFVLALSLANLCFLSIWYALLSSTSYFAAGPPHSIHFVAVVINVLVGAIVFWTVLTVARRTARERALVIAEAVVMAALVIPLNDFDTWFPQLSGVKSFITIPGIGLPLTVVLLVVALLISPKRVSSALGKVVFALSPLVLMTFGQAFYRMATATEPEVSVAAPIVAASAAPSVAGGDNRAPRIVWILFDELEERMAFSNRLPHVKLPEFDRLRAQSVYATNAYSPAGRTELSIPALVTGKLVSSVRPTSKELMLTFKDAPGEAPLSLQPNLFSQAADEGLNSAIVGWYFPYCRAFGSRLSGCLWEPSEEFAQLTWPKMSLWRSIALQLRIEIKASPLAGWVINLFRKSESLKQTVTDATAGKDEHLASTLKLLEGARKVVADPKLDLVFIHLPVPHYPGIYSCRSADYLVSGHSTYLDNLCLADKVLGELRSAMETAGVWDSSTVFVTGDHWWKVDMYSESLGRWSTEEAEASGSKIDKRVPFIMKLAHQRESLPYEQSFNTVVVRDLFSDLLRGNVKTPADVESWLTQHRKFGESPITY